MLGGPAPGVEFVEDERGIVGLTVRRDGPEASLSVCGVPISVMR